MSRAIFVRTLCQVAAASSESLTSHHNPALPLWGRGGLDPTSINPLHQVLIRSQFNYVGYSVLCFHLVATPSALCLLQSHKTSKHIAYSYCISPNVGRYFGLVTGPPPPPAMGAMEAEATERFRRERSSVANLTRINLIFWIYLT